jgi:integrase
MPAEQQGSLYKTKTGSGVRYRDAEGRQCRQGGFKNDREALRWLDDKLDDVQRERRGEVVRRHVEAPTLDELADEYLAVHVASAGTIRALTDRLLYARRAFGSQRVDRLSVTELRRWRGTLPALSAWGITKALRQLLSYAVECGYVTENIAKKVPNPEPQRRERETFETIEEVRAVDAELSTVYDGVCEFGVLTALRPEELFAAERRDVDRQAKILRVRRVVVDGVVREGGKTPGSVRDVPLTDAALAVLDRRPPRLDTPLLFPSAKGKHVNLDNFRSKHFGPAVRAAGIDRPLVPYSMRHTGLSWWIAGGLDLQSVAAIGGTSLEQLSKTYGHKTPDAAARARAAMEARTAAKTDETKEGTNG